jgi:hypothetical protein
MSSSAPQVLSDDEVVECARAVAIVALRFNPKNIRKIYSAYHIAEAVGNSLEGQLSTFRVDTDTLKKAFATKNIRDGLMRGVPGRSEFNRSSTQFDVITSGP